MATTTDVTHGITPSPETLLTSSQENLTPAKSITLPKAVRQVGFWSGILSGFLAFGWFAAMVVQTIQSPPEPWTGIDAFVRSFQFIQMLNFIPSLPLAAAFLVLMVCVYFYASEEKKIWGMLGLAFTIVYSVMTSINYLIQLLVVRQSLALGETEGLGLFAHINSHSVWGTSLIWEISVRLSPVGVHDFFMPWPHLFTPPSHRPSKINLYWTTPRQWANGSL